MTYNRRGGPRRAPADEPFDPFEPPIETVHRCSRPRYRTSRARLSPRRSSTSPRPHARRRIGTGKRSCTPTCSTAPSRARSKATGAHLSPRRELDRAAGRPPRPHGEHQRDATGEAARRLRLQHRRRAHGRRSTDLGGNTRAGRRASVDSPYSEARVPDHFTDLAGVSAGPEDLLETNRLRCGGSPRSSAGHRLRSCSPPSRRRWLGCWVRLLW